MESGFGGRVKSLAQGVEFFAGAVEKFVETNIIEKEQREQNIKKLAQSVDRFVKEKVPAANLVRPSVSLKVKKLEHFKGDLPKYESTLASGMDVRAQMKESVTLQPGDRTLIPTGLSFEIPEGYEIQARPRSGLAIKQGLTLLNTPGTIDADYRGEVKIIIINLAKEAVTINDQDRIAQLVVAPVLQVKLIEVDGLSESDRGSGGFGSTGVSAESANTSGDTINKSEGPSDNDPVEFTENGDETSNS